MRSHGSQPSVLLVLAALMVFTAIEYVLSQLSAGLTLLLVVGLFKFLLVIIYFMHLPRLWAPEAEAEKEQK